MNLFNLKDKSILITGSSKGIGKSIAHQCALHGANVVISSRKLNACELAAQEINDSVGKNVALPIITSIFLARVIATFNRLASVRKPRFFVLTQEKMMTSLSCP